MTYRDTENIEIITPLKWQCISQDLNIVSKAHTEFNPTVHELMFFVDDASWEIIGIKQDHKDRVPTMGLVVS